MDKTPKTVALASPLKGFAIDPVKKTGDIPKQLALKPFPALNPLTVGINIDDIGRNGQCERVLSAKGGLEFKFNQPKALK